MTAEIAMTARNAAREVSDPTNCNINASGMAYAYCKMVSPIPHSL